MNHNQYVEIFIMLIISGLLSTKNVWVDNISDIRYSINDLYKILLTAGWMGSFMGFYYRDNKILSYGLILVVITIICIRTQFLVSENQYILDMIPHNSMSIHMSKERLNKNNTSNDFNHFIRNTIDDETTNIFYMKNKKN
jgi:membrane-bound acyltransferase YfiQ involved in biofilm formation